MASISSDSWETICITVGLFLGHLCTCTCTCMSVCLSVLISPPLSLQDDFIQEDYEEASQFQPTPSPSHPPRQPAPPQQHTSTEPHIDLTKTYESAPNGIDLSKVYVALWDFTAAEKDELSLRRGDLVQVADPNPEAQWWAGEGLDSEASSKTGNYGFLPASYVMVAFEEVA